MDKIFKIGQQLEARSTAGALRNGGGLTKMTVTAVDRKNKRLTVDQLPTDIAVNDALYNFNSYGTAPAEFELARVTGVDTTTKIITCYSLAVALS